LVSATDATGIGSTTGAGTGAAEAGTGIDGNVFVLFCAVALPATKTPNINQ
jgi:hypothetical protein